MYNQVNQAIDSGVIKVDDSGAVSVVDDPNEREQIASASKLRRRKADVHGMQMDDDDVIDGLLPMDYEQEQHD